MNARHARLAAAIVGLLVMLGCSYLAPRGRVPGPVVAEGGIVFRYHAPAATRVQLAGDWPENNWARGDGSAGEANIGLMSDDDGDGVWEITVALGPGRYHYIFWVDETVWRLDPGNPEDAPGGPAGTVSLLTVFMRNGRLETR